MSDAESDGDIYHAGGMSHSRRSSCAICREESEDRRRSKLTDTGRRAEDLLVKITKAISRGTLPAYLHDLATRLQDAEHVQETCREQLNAEYQRGVEDERKRVWQLIRT